MKSKSVDEVLTEATVKNRSIKKGGTVSIGGIKLKVCRRTGMVKQALCKVVAFLLPDCIIRLDSLFEQGMFLLPNTVKQKACKSSL